MADVSLTLLVLKSRQVDRGRTFYEALGIAFTEERHGTGPRHHAGRIGDVVMEVYPLPDDGTADITTRLGFTVENLAEVVQALQGLGTPVAKEPTQTAWRLQAVVKDPVLQDYNPMYRRGEELLARYITELPQPEPGHSRILIINNSSLPFTEARTNTLGVMHKAIIVTPDEAERRIVNSTMLVTEGEEIAAEKQEEFVRTDKISQKNY